MTSPNKISSREDCIALMDTIKAKIVELKNTSDNLHSNWSKEDEKQSIHSTKTKPPNGGFVFVQRVDYATASLSAFAAENLGAFLAETLTVSPVFGLRASRAARSFTENLPNPAIETSSPFLSDFTIVLKIVSTTCSACTFVVPSSAFTTSTRDALFI